MPAPEELPRSVWEKEILPYMEYYLGRNSDNPDHPLNRMSLEESYSVRNSGLFPQESVLTEKEWESICKYYLSNAPADTSTRAIIPGNTRLQELFEEKAVPISSAHGLQLTLVSIEANDSLVYLGTESNQLLTLSYRDDFYLDQVIHTRSSPVDLFTTENQFYVLEIGEIMPNDERKGTLNRYNLKGVQELLLRDLRRPVRMAFLKDDPQSITIAEFGHLTGEVSELTTQGTKKSVIGKSGAVDILFVDMDGDDKEELVCLFAQADEGIIICKKDNDLYDCKTVLRFSPLFGSSDLEVADMDRDGRPDLIVAHGDNADYSLVPKDYHGVTIFGNLGNLNFAESYFYPMDGCTNVELADFDMDSSPDLICSSYFPVFDRDSQMSASIVLLLNSDGAYEAFSFDSMNRGRWMVMDSGDLDRDGDVDVILGSYTRHPTPIPENIRQNWQEEGISCLFLRNKTVSQ